MFYYVYVLRSDKDKQLYVGYTSDLHGRFEAHQSGHVASTKDRRPLRLIYAEACTERADAVQREAYLKSYRGKLFLRKRLKSYFTGVV